MRFWVALLMMASGCAGAGFPDVLDAAEVSMLASAGAPSISRVRDLGSPRVPRAGAWKGESDGVAGPGEFLLIEGSGFGRQPTITVGGRATAIAARTEGGGVIVKVPAGVPVGEVEIEVAVAKGRASKPFPLRRFAVVVHDGELRFLTVTRAGAQLAGGALAVPGARRVRIAGDGGAAYVLASGAGGARFVTVDLGAPNAPRISDERKLAHRADLIASAEDAPVAVAVGDGQLTLFVCDRASVPAPYDPVRLPRELDGARAIELSPDGKLLAALIPDGNRLAVADISQPGVARLVNKVDLLPAERLPLVRDLAFSSDGETLWVVSGDNAQTLPAVQPTRITAVRLLVENEAPNGPAPPSGRGRLLSVWRTQTMTGATAPLHLAVARGQPLASGTTIRMPPEKAAVFVTALADALFKLGELDLSTAAGAQAAQKLWRPPTPGMLVRADINGGGGPLFTTPQILSALELTPDAQLVVAASARVSAAPSVEGVVLDFGVTAAPIWGTPEPVFISLGKLRPSELKPPFDFGDVRIQP